MMRRVLVTTLVASVLAGCSPPSAPHSTPQETSSPRTPSPSHAPEMPPEPQPTAGGPCPYLDENVVAEVNGQRVARVRTSTDEKYPVCFFYALTGEVQLTVRVYAGDAAIATQLVDAAAPVDTSNPAEEPPGWRGGYQRTETGAVYAVAKQTAAVVVTTNQRQSIKARGVAERAIVTLGL